MEFAFTLKCFLQPNADAGAVVERLALQGCNDALVGIGHEGVIVLDFIREAPTSEQAVSSAMADVRRAAQGDFLIRVTPGPTPTIQGE